MVRAISESKHEPKTFLFIYRMLRNSVHAANCFRGAAPIAAPHMLLLNDSLISEQPDGATWGTRDGRGRGPQPAEAARRIKPELNRHQQPGM
jgi:hypothetical protein